MQVCTSLQTDNHASTPPLSFLQAGCPSCRPTNSVKALKAQAQTNNYNGNKIKFNKKYNNRSIIGIGRLSADADCQMADTDYRQTGR